MVKGWDWATSERDRSIQEKERGPRRSPPGLSPESGTCTMAHLEPSRTGRPLGNNLMKHLRRISQMEETHEAGCGGAAELSGPAWGHHAPDAA